MYSYLIGWFPFIYWVPRYQFKKLVLPDLIAGKHGSELGYQLSAHILLLLKLLSNNDSRSSRVRRFAVIYRRGAALFKLVPTITFFASDATVHTNPACRALELTLTVLCHFIKPWFAVGRLL